ncbi:MAG: DUF4167 domain-containing protein [Alphaproteobacteria bacterium]|nr:DUF4167 domain-containing protein [Alphaproteobacteria bacterium]
MRSSNKSRSRNKNQNRRQSTNVVNRVFDSSGPEGKVRGTPQQIVEKYQMLARDAQLAGDRVAMENFQQHAEHYLRLLNDAMREQNQRREAHEAQQAQHAQQRRDNQQQGGGEAQPESNTPEPQQPEQPDLSEQPQPMAVTEAEEPTDSGLVETPEGKSKQRRKRTPKKPDAAPEQAAE